MRIVIDIDEARFKDIQRIAEVQLESNHFKTAEQIIANGTPIEQEPKTVSIPEGATNGDVVKIMFNKTFPKTIILYKNDESRLTINPMFSREWWEMPYKKSEVQDADSD